MQNTARLTRKKDLDYLLKGAKKTQVSSSLSRGMMPGIIPLLRAESSSLNSHKEASLLKSLI